MDAVIFTDCRVFFARGENTAFKEQAHWFGQWIASLWSARYLSPLWSSAA
jgi:hypothetical protein